MNYKALIEQTKPLYDKWNEILKNDVHFFLPPTSIHTYEHCDRVLKYGLVIGKEEGLTDDQMQSLAASCIFHDCGRKDDYVDFQHGERSAQKYKVYCLTHELEFDNRSYLAIFYHNLSDDEGIRAFEKNGLKFCAYSCIPYNSVVRGIQLSCTNNIANKQDNKLFISKDINNSENPSVQHFLDTYHKYCTELPKVRRLTDKRKNAILKMRNKFTWDEIIQVFQNVKESDFLNGRNDRGWKADLDFILREDKFVAILEGKYNSKKRSNKKLEVFGESDEVSNEQYTEEELAELEKLNAERRANGQRTHF